MCETLFCYLFMWCHISLDHQLLSGGAVTDCNFVLLLSPYVKLYFADIFSCSAIFHYSPLLSCGDVADCNFVLLLSRGVKLYFADLFVYVALYFIRPPAAFVEM